MAKVTNYKDYLKSQYEDEETWAFNKKLLTALGFFVVSIKIIRNYGELLTI